MPLLIFICVSSDTYIFTSVCNRKAESKQVLDGCFNWPCAVERASQDIHPQNQARLVCKKVARNSQKDLV